MQCVEIKNEMKMFSFMLCITRGAFSDVNFLFLFNDGKFVFCKNNFCSCSDEANRTKKRNVNITRKSKILSENAPVKT